MKVIDANAFLGAYFIGLTRISDTEWQKGYWDGVDDVLDNLKESYTFDAVPIIRARWIKSLNGYRCPVCDYRDDESKTKKKYCPNCGAKMDLKANK